MPPGWYGTGGVSRAMPTASAAVVAASANAARSIVAGVRLLPPPTCGPPTSVSVAPKVTTAAMLRRAST